MKYPRLKILAFLALGSPVLLTAPGIAVDKAMSVISRTFKFVESAAGKDIVLIVNDGGADAAAINAFLTAKPELSGNPVTPQMISPADLAGYSGNVAAIIVPDTAATAFSAVNESATRLGTIAISTGLECVKAHLCTLGIEVDPRINIYVSRTARSAHNIAFNSAFLVMAKEL